MQLSEIKKQQICTILTLPKDITFSRRLNDMGFCCGEQVKCITIATFKSPILFSVQGSQVALRKVDADKIGVVL